MKRRRLLLRLFPWELESIDEYSCSLPTGTTIGKMWKRDMNEAERYHTGRPLPEEWVVAMYIPDDRPDSVGIVWFNVELRQGPHPRSYHAPDWCNRKHFKFSLWRDEERRA